MKKTTYPIIVIVVALALAAFFAFQIVQGSSRANFVSGSSSASMGDLRRFEAQKIVQNAKAPGIGDLRRFEAQKVVQNAKAPGFGDLRRFEAQKVVQNAKALGFGDLQKFEAMQIGSPAAASMQRVCPNSSTPAGEHDAGASAPATVLRAMGC